MGKGNVRSGAQPIEDSNYEPSVSFVLTRPYFAPCLVRRATHTTVKVHRRAASASQGDTAAVTGPSYPGDRRRLLEEPRRVPHNGLRSRGRGGQARVGPRTAIKRKRWRPQTPRLRCSPAPRCLRPPPLKREPRPPGAMTPAHTAGLARPAYLSGRRGGALNRGDVPLHLGLAAPHRAADQAPRERQAGSGAYSGCGLQEVSAEHP